MTPAQRTLAESVRDIPRRTIPPQVCDCGEKLLPVGAITLCDDGRTHHGVTECEPCEVAS